jgi:hypothetical protein
LLVILRVVGEVVVEILLLRKVHLEVEAAEVVVVVELVGEKVEMKDRNYYNSKTIYKIDKSKRVVNGKKY